MYKFLPFIGFGALQPMSGNGIHGFKASKMTWLDLLNLICTCLSSYQTSRKRFQDKMQTIRPFLRDRLYDSFLAHEMCQDGPVALVSQAASANFQRPWLRLRAHGTAKFAAAMSLDVQMHGRCMELNLARFHRPGTEQQIWAWLFYQRHDWQAETASKHDQGRCVAKFFQSGQMDVRLRTCMRSRAACSTNFLKRYCLSHRYQTCATEARGKHSMGLM